MQGLTNVKLNLSLNFKCCKLTKTKITTVALATNGNKLKY